MSTVAIVESVRTMKLKDIEPLRRVRLLAGLDDAQLERLSRGAYLQRFPKGTTLFEPGDAPDFLHVLLEGAVELVGRTVGARETVIEILWPVDCFIPAAALTSTPYLMGARTLEPSQVLLLEASNLRRCVRDDAGLASIMIALLAGHFRDMVRQVKDLKLRTGTQRLACFLLRLVEETGEDGSTRLPFSKGTLASRLGMTAENLSRAFRNLEQAGLEVRGSRIIVHDRAKLEDICRLDALIDRHDAALSVQDR
jgi:CRP/FNR family transcriptional activator FtrB